MDPDQLLRCFVAERRTLHGVARRIVGAAADADDVVQDAWLRVAASPPSTAPRVPLAWWTTTVRRLAIDVVRHRAATARAHDALAGASAIDGSRWSGDGTTRDDAVDALLRRLCVALSAVEVAALLLRVVFDEDIPTIARSLRRSEGAVRVLIHRARRRARDERRPARGDPDDARTATTFAVCRQAIAACDLRLLHAVLAEHAATAVASAIARPIEAPPARLAIALVDGRPTLVLRQGRALLCTLSMPADGRFAAAARTAPPATARC